jgi:ubiquitin carboxyl-terminal hydrolase 8
MNLEKYKGMGLTGLSNLGNTCFLNSTIQCLSHCYEFNDFLNEEKWSNNLNEVNDSLLLIEWNSLRKLMWSENCVISPGRFVTTVQKVSSVKQRDLFTGFAQNDLPEFLLFLIECFHNSINRKVKINISGKIINNKDKLAKECYEMIKNMYSKDYSEILDIFYGTHISIVKDTNYTVLNNTPEPYFLINLPIPDTKEPNLYDCFDLYTDEELLTNDEKYMYKGEKIDAFREIKFWSFPKVLVIDLKRFTSNGKKNNKLITFPLEELNLTKYCM